MAKSDHEGLPKGLRKVSVLRNGKRQLENRITGSDNKSGGSVAPKNRSRGGMARTNEGLRGLGAGLNAGLAPGGNTTGLANWAPLQGRSYDAPPPEPTTTSPTTTGPTTTSPTTTEPPPPAPKPWQQASDWKETPYPASTNAEDLREYFGVNPNGGSEEELRANIDTKRRMWHARSNGPAGGEQAREVKEFIRSAEAHLLRDGPAPTQ